jgi:hypothetical protein
VETRGGVIQKQIAYGARIGAAFNLPDEHKKTKQFNGKD